MTGESRDADRTRHAGQGGTAQGTAHAVLVAAGRGERLELDLPKARILLAQTPLFLHSLRTLLGHPLIGDLVLVVPAAESEIRAAQEILAAAAPPAAVRRVAVIGGGEQRRDSVRLGLSFLQEHGASAEDVVLIHDAARPLLSTALITRCIDSLGIPLAADGQSVLPGLLQDAAGSRFAAGVVPGLPVRDTLKLVYEERVVLTQPRENLWAVQTPQIFRFGPLAAAHRRARSYGVVATDDAALIEWYGLPVRMILGDPTNLKITYPEDLDLAERLLESWSTRPREGGAR